MERKQALSLFLIPSLIWGSTWYAITFQLGKVDPIVSVAYRSTLAGITLLVFAFFTGKKLRFSSADHFFLFLQGLFLYGVNYWFVYLAETAIPSGLVAVVFSLVVLMNVFFGNIFLKIPIQKKIIVGAILGLIGTLIIFLPEILKINFNRAYINALVICFSGVILASLGNIVASYNFKRDIPIIQSNAYGMIYGGVLLAIIAFIIGKKFNFDFSTKYVSSLLYLAIFGSVLAFNAYLKLMSLWGPGKAAYIVLVTPIIAIIISAFLEDYHITSYTIGGAGLVLFGNYIVVIKK